MKLTHVCILLWISAAGLSHAAELQPRIAHQALGISLSNIPFPDTLARDLTSGFESRVVIRIAVVSSEKVIERRDVMIAARYDLWEERFAIKTRVGDTVVGNVTFSQVNEALRYLASIDLDGLFPMERFQRDQDIAMQAEVSINPIEREKMERVRKWVATNSAPGVAISANPAGSPLTAKPNDLFNAIFEQYLRGEDVVATWKMTIASNKFKLRPDMEANTK